MKTLILCDKESTQYDNLNLCEQTRTAVQAAGSEAQVVELDGDEIKPCRGCFQCWLKTPGLCVMTDDCANTVSMQEIQSDAMIVLTKITYGGYSYDLKSFLDRSIPNLSPFFEIIDGEMHHKMRYDRFPYMITIGYGACTPKERQTFFALAERNALNLRPPKHFAFVVQNTDELEKTMKSLESVLFREVQA